MTSSFQEFKEVLTHDINNISFTVGKTIARQTQGVPMGSPCSPALSIALYAPSMNTGSYNNTQKRSSMVGDSWMTSSCVSHLKQTQTNSRSFIQKPLDLEEEKVDKQATFKYLQTATNCAKMATWMWGSLTRIPNARHKASSLWRTQYLLIPMSCPQYISQGWWMLCMRCCITQILWQHYKRVLNTKWTSLTRAAYREKWRLNACGTWYTKLATMQLTWAESLHNNCWNMQQSKFTCAQCAPTRPTGKKVWLSFMYNWDVWGQGFVMFTWECF